MDVDAYRAAFRGSAMKRAKLPAMKRTPAVVLGNVGSTEDVPALATALSDDEPLVRAHAAWALGRIGSPAAASALRDRLDVDADAGARAELDAALRAVAAARRARAIEVDVPRRACATGG